MRNAVGTIFYLSVDDIVRLRGKSANHVLDVTNGLLFNRDEMQTFTSLDDRTLEMYHNWYKLDDKYYYFKTRHVFFELFVAELAKEFNVRCANICLGRDMNTVGLLSENFRDNDSIYYFYNEYFLDHDIDMIPKVYSLKDNFENLSEENKESIVNEICRLLALDFFTAQRDRKSYNVSFEENHGELSLAPMYDNGACINTVDLNNISTCFGDLNFPSDDNVSNLNYITLRFISEYKEFFRYIEKALGINIQNIFDRVINKYKILITKEERKLILSIFDSKKRIIENALKLSRRI